MKVVLIIITLCFVFNINAQPNNSEEKWPSSELSSLLDEAYFWTIEIDTLNKMVRIPFTLSTNPDNENYYLKSFPSTSNIIDTSEFYNRINIGYLELNYIDKRNRVKKCYMVDSKYMTDIDSNKVKNEYNQLKLGGEFSEWKDMETFHRAYRLLFEITWLAIIYDTFSVQECYRLRKLLGPSLGPEYFENLGALITLVKIINYSETNSK